MRPLCALLLAGVLLAAAAPIEAHHSFAAQYDIRRPVAFKGILSEVEFVNPHVWLQVKEVDAAGNVVKTWEVELNGNATTLSRRGWRMTSLKVGDTITLEGHRARCCENVMNAPFVMTADGKKAMDPNTDAPK